MTVVVMGATGGQGGAVVDALLEAGRQVRAVVRGVDSPKAQALSARGVRTVTGDLSDAASLAPALDGAEAAFGVTTPFEAGLDAEVAQGAAIIEAARATGCPHLVMASVASADQGTGIPHFETKARIERALVASGLPYTVVAPTYFFDNTLGDTESVAAGVLELAVPPEQPLQQVDRGDYGQVVASVVTERDRWLGRRVEVAGDAPTPLEMAGVLGEVTGRPVLFREIPLAAVRARSADMGAMFAFLGAGGYQVDMPRLRGCFPEVTWTSFAAWAARQQWV